jgi:hypothetical protein
VERTVRAARVGPRFGPDGPRESSGLAASARVPGLLWTLDDGGAAPDLLAVAADDGRVLGRVRVAGATNVDWEALAAGPCADVADARPGAAVPRRAPHPPPARTPPATAPPATPLPVGARGGCLWVGDVGDNAAAGYGGDGARASVTLYRVPEPLGALAGGLPPRRGRSGPALPTTTASAVALGVRYADGPRDVEAMAVFPDGEGWLITKHPVRRADGSPRPALVYRVPAAAWAGAAPGGAPAAPVTAPLVDSLPLVPDATITHRVTDAALDAARRLLVVRTYAAVYLVPVAGPPWRVDRARPATRCRVGVLGEPQGEGVAVLPGPAVTLALSSETNLLGRGGLAFARCPPAG